jgi:Fur family ferric uptake transcriptional regulator
LVSRYDSRPKAGSGFAAREAATPSTLCFAPLAFRVAPSANDPQPHRIVIQLRIAVMPARAQDLKDAGLKATLPRMKVLDLFQNSKVRHMTAEDVYRLLMDDGLDVGLATIYRVLTQFEQAGLLKRHHFEGGKSIFELNEGDKHDHIVCVNTGKVVEFHDAEIEKRIAKIVSDHGFELVDHVLHIRALAPTTDAPKRLVRKLR